MYLKTCLQCFDAVGWACRQSRRHLKTEWWCDGVLYLSAARCKWLAYGPANAIDTVPPHHPCFSTIQNGLSFCTVSAYCAHCPGKRPLNECSLCCIYLKISPNIQWNPTRHFQIVFGDRRLAKFIAILLRVEVKFNGLFNAPCNAGLGRKNGKIHDFLKVETVQTVSYTHLTLPTNREV